MGVISKTCDSKASKTIDLSKSVTVHQKDEEAAQDALINRYTSPMLPNPNHNPKDPKSPAEIVNPDYEDCGACSQAGHTCQTRGKFDGAWKAGDWVSVKTEDGNHVKTYREYTFTGKLILTCRCDPPEKKDGKGAGAADPKKGGGGGDKKGE